MPFTGTALRRFLASPPRTEQLALDDRYIYLRSYLDAKPGGEARGTRIALQEAPRLLNARARG